MIEPPRRRTTYALTQVESEEATHQTVLALMEHGAPGPADLFRVMLARPSWQQYAACRGAGTSTHFPNQGAGIADARAVCAGCEVCTECLAYALDGSHPRRYLGRHQRT